MAERDGSDAGPFWRNKRLEDMTESEWESLCDGCGRCCLEKLKADDSGEVYNVDVGCELLDPASGRCSDYANRLTRDVGCFKLAPTHVPDMDWLPPTCAYRRVFLGKPLEWWHPLVSGDPNTVHQAGISAAGRFIRPRHAGPLEYHTIDWPLQDATDEIGRSWTKAMFGGVNASVPTAFGADGRIDLDLMAAHCFWLLANGCHGLAILDSAGEVATLAMQERVQIVAGLVSRGIPASKLLVGLGSASIVDGVRNAQQAAELGIRGVFVRASATGLIMPSDALSGAVRGLIHAINPALHLYLSLSVSSSAAAACLTALEAFIAQEPERLRGIRDESPGCGLGLATLERFRGRRFEVYTTDEDVLAEVVRRGGAGLISPGANLLGRLCAAVLQATEPDQSMNVQRAIVAAGDVLRSRPSVLVIKTLLARHTGIPAWGKVRLPLRPLRRADREALFRAFDATGIRLRSAT
jgi:uncharacterized cysteine cluster protein YcgN (CxxCxxCC family)/dihydrodipicolinate synthase/N-acetylneuraminate lyase